MREHGLLCYYNYGDYIMREEFDIYTVNVKYIRNLMNVESRLSDTGRCNAIASVSPQEQKQGRPYLGIIVIANNRKYCIPFSSVTNKEKYNRIAENITLRKILDPSGAVIGILNINNMIPVREEYVTKLDIAIHPEDRRNQALTAHKQLLQKELKWCRENAQLIEKLANDLHELVCSSNPFGKRKICPHYDELEKECDKGKPIPNRAIKKMNRTNIIGKLKKIKRTKQYRRK